MWAHMDRPIIPVPIQPTRVVDGVIFSVVVDMAWFWVVEKTRVGGEVMECLVRRKNEFGRRKNNIGEVNVLSG